MADNIAITPGSGSTVRTDDVGGIQYQVVKFDLGGDGVSVVPSVNSGTKDSGTLRVILASDQTVVPINDNGGSITVDGSVTIGGAVTEDTASVGGEVLIAMAGARNDAAAAKTSTDGDWGAIAIDSAGRVGISDLGGTISIDDGAGSITVDGAVTVSGTVTTSPPSNASTNVAQVAGTAADVNSGNKSAGTLRVVLATDQPQLTNKLLVTPDANAAINNAQVSGTAVSVNSGVKDAGTQRVILASDQTVVPVSDNAGSLTVDAPVGTPAFVRLSDGAAAITTLPVSIAATVDVKSSSQGKTPAFAKVDTASSGQTAIVAADATRKIKVVSYVLVADGAVTAKWQNASTDLTGAMSLSANGGVSAIGNFDSHIMETSVNQALNLNLGGAVGVRGHISYFLET